MSLWKDMTLNERVFRQNINNGTSILISTYLSIYSYKLVNWEYPTMDVTVVSELYGPWTTLFTPCVDLGFPNLHKL